MDYVAIRIEKTANGSHSESLEFLKAQNIIPGLRWNGIRKNIERLAGDFKSLCMYVASPYGKTENHPRVKWVPPSDISMQMEALDSYAVSTFKSWSYGALKKVKYVFINHETQHWDAGTPEIVKALKDLYARYSSVCPNAIVTFYNQGQKRSPQEKPFGKIPFGVPYVLKQCSLYEDRTAIGEPATIASTEPDLARGNLAVNVNLFRFWDYPNHRGPREYTRYGASRTPNFEKGRIVGAFRDEPIRVVFLNECVPPWEESGALSDEFEDRFLAFAAGVNSIPFTE